MLKLIARGTETQGSIPDRTDTSILLLTRNFVDRFDNKLSHEF